MNTGNDAGRQSVAGWSIVRQFPAVGGEADVFLVEKDGKQRVLKNYRYGILPDSAVFERLVQVGRKHQEGFVRLFEFGTDPTTGNFYELAEFIPGGSLADLLTGDPLPEETTLLIVGQLSRALSILHDEGILHLDLKPANVLLRQREPLVLAVSDFGISSVFDAGMSKKLTVVKGTSLYQSPESLSGVVLAKSDWWSFGILVLELLLGRHPLAGLQEQVILFQLTTQGIDVPKTLSPRWQNLLQGLLTRNPDHRWGAPELRQWLAGQTPETWYAREAATTTTQSSQAGQTSSFLRFEAGLVLDGKTWHSLEEFMTAAFSGPSGWETAKGLVNQGTVSDWLAENQDSDRAGQLRTFMAEEQDPDVLLFKAGMYFRPDLPFVWRGRQIDPDCLTAFLEHLVRGTLPPEEASLIEGLFTGRIFKDYMSITMRGLGNLESFFRKAQAFKGTEFEAWPLPERCHLLLLASRQTFSADQAVPTLQAILEDQASERTAVMKCVQMKGFPGFAQKAGIWKPGDQALWEFVSKILTHEQYLKKVILPQFFTDLAQILPQIQTDSSFRAFIGKLLAKAPLDLGLIINIRTHLSAHPCIESLIRAVYRLPPKESLESCLGGLMVTASLEAALAGEWDNLEKKYLLPPYLYDLRSGKVLSQAQLKTIRLILDDPDLLCKKTPDIPTFATLVGVLPMNSHDQDSPEFLEFAKKNRPRPGSSLGAYLTAGVILAVGWMVLTPNFHHHNYERGGEKACYANMRVILGAIEMYNMDHAAMIDDFNGSTEGILLQGSYLKSPITPPEKNCSYGNNAPLSGSGRVTCVSHGGIE